MIFVVQPYAFWVGHYRLYLRALAVAAHTYIYADTENLGMPREVRWKPYVTRPHRSVLRFIASRVLNGLRAVWTLRTRVCYSRDVVHFLELEPLSFLLHEMLTRRKVKQVILTVHAVKSILRGTAVQRGFRAAHGFLRDRALRHVVSAKYAIVVHSETHRQALIQIFGAQSGHVTHIPYPCPSPKTNRPRSVNMRKLLIYGMVREDKGIYEFFRDHAPTDLSITLAGCVIDRRVLSVVGRNITVIDRYVSETERDELFGRHDFLLLPYASTYTGGAGPLKDAFAYGVPAVCSDIPIFREIVDGYGTGLVIALGQQLEDIIRSITPASYEEMSRRCLDYAATNNWDNLRRRYFELYEKLSVDSSCETD